MATSGSSSAAEILRALSRMADPDKARILSGFFKTGPGEYGEGDRFWGIPVPRVRALLKTCFPVPLSVVEELLASPFHEARFFAVAALARAANRGGPDDRARLCRFYLAHARGINNWDLVDVSAPSVVGGHLPPGGGRRVLAGLAASPCLWERRIAMVSTLGHMRRGDVSNTFWLAERLLADPEDLMHKAAGWMLREAGKRDPAALESFLSRHAPQMPRTLLRYAIERLPAARRQAWMAVRPVPATHFPRRGK